MRSFLRFTSALWLCLHADTFVQADMGPPLMPQSEVSLGLAGIALSLSFFLSGLWLVRNARPLTRCLAALAFVVFLSFMAASGKNETLGFVMFLLALTFFVFCFVRTVYRRPHRTEIPSSVREEMGGEAYDAHCAQIEHRYRESKLLLLASFLFFLSLLICIVSPQTSRGRQFGQFRPIPREGPPDTAKTPQGEPEKQGQVEK